MSVLAKEERMKMRNEIDCCPAAYQFDGEDMTRALDTIDALEAERDEWEHRAEAAEATQDAVAMLLQDTWGFIIDGHVIGASSTLQRAMERCPPVEEARERTRKFAAAFDQLLHPTGRCECEVNGWPCDWCSKECEMCGTQRCTGCGCDSECLGCRDYAERVAELEAERDALRRVVAAVREVVK